MSSDRQRQLGLKFWSVLAVFALGAAVFPRPAQAVIAVDTPLSSILGMSKQVMPGKVVRVDADAKKVEVEIEKDLKPEITAWASAQREAGQEMRLLSKFRPKFFKPVTPELYQRHLEKQVRQPIPEKIVVDLEATPELAGLLKPGDPAVAFLGRKGGMVHIADSACPVEQTPEGSPPVWTLAKRLEAWLPFPGYTADIVQCVNDLASGMTRMEMVGAGTGVHRLFGSGSGKNNELLKLKAAPKFLAAGDVNGDGFPDVLAGLNSGVQFLIATAGGTVETYALKDATAEWGLDKAQGAAAYFADVNGDGKSDLLLGDTLYLSDGKTFQATPCVGKLPAGADLLAVGLEDTNNDGKPDAQLLLRDGQLYVFENNGALDKPWTAKPVVTLWKDTPDDAVQMAFFRVNACAGRHYVMVLRTSGPWRYALDPSTGEPPADFLRLTGQEARKSHKGTVADNMHVIAAAAGHINSENNRTQDTVDYYVCVNDPQTKLGCDFSLINRYYGSFYANGAAGDWRGCGGLKKKPPFINPVAITLADFDRSFASQGWEDMLYATADGGLFAVKNSGYGGTPEQYEGLPPSMDEQRKALQGGQP